MAKFPNDLRKIFVTFVALFYFTDSFFNTCQKPDLSAHTSIN